MMGGVSIRSMEEGLQGLLVNFSVLGLFVNKHRFPIYNASPSHPMVNIVI